MSGGPRWDRRRLLRTGAAAVGGAGVGWSTSAVVANTAHAGELDAVGAAGRGVVRVGVSAGAETVALAGRHQPGIDTPTQAHASLLGWDLLPGSDTTHLVRLMRLLTDDARRLGSGRPALADTEPELAAHPSRLTVTFGFGPRVLRELAPGVGGGEATAPIGRRPLEDLPRFARDELEEPWGQTDVIAQVACDDPLTLAHARRVLTKDARPLARLRWIQSGFRNARGTAPGSTMRNLMGQVDGTANPDPALPDFDPLVWIDDGPLAGGTCLVLRRIRMHLDTWDKVDRLGREATIGRRLDTGAPLTGTGEFDPVDLQATDTFGLPVIDPASHVARARSTDPAERFLRRGFNYTDADPTRPDGEDSGLLFVAFAADPQRQFVPVQRRLHELDRLNTWVTTIGSAVYAVPPAAREDDAGDYVGSALLEPAAQGSGA